jgi:hypothetical protein
MLHNKKLKYLIWVEILKYSLIISIIFILKSHASNIGITLACIRLIAGCISLQLISFILFKLIRKERDNK